jgi:hypothetical protein
MPDQSRMTSSDAFKVDLGAGFPYNLPMFVSSTITLIHAESPTPPVSAVTPTRKVVRLTPTLASGKPDTVVKLKPSPTPSPANPASALRAAADNNGIKRMGSVVVSARGRGGASALRGAGNRLVAQALGLAARSAGIKKRPVKAAPAAPTVGGVAKAARTSFGGSRLLQATAS